MKVNDVRRLIDQARLRGGAPDAFWMSRLEAQELLQDAMGPPFDPARLAPGHAFTLLGVPICVFQSLSNVWE